MNNVTPINSWEATNRQTDVTVRLNTYGTFEQTKKTLERLKREIELSGFNAEIVDAKTVKVSDNGDGSAA